MAERKKVGDLKKDGFYWYILLVLHTSIIMKGCIDESFLQGLKHSKWVVIPSYVLSALAQNAKMDHKKHFQKSLQTTQLLPMLRCNLLKQTLNLVDCIMFGKLFWFFRNLKQEIE